MSYDSQGRVRTQQDALGLTTGQQTTLGYVANGDGSQTTTVTYPATSFDGYKPTVADTYDAQGRLIKRATTPSASDGTYTETFGYDANFDLTSFTDARNNPTTFCYDVDYAGKAIAGSAGNVTRTIAPAPAGGANPLVMLARYDGKNNLVETVAPKGVANGASVTCTTDLSAAVNTLYATDNAYDANGVDLLSVTRRYSDADLGQQTAVTKFEYNDAANPGRVTRLIPPRGNSGGSPDYSYATSFAYYGSGSQAGMLQSATDAVGNQTTSAYDPVGRRLSMVDPDGNVAGGSPSAHTWTSAYDNEDRLTSAGAPAPATSGTAWPRWIRVPIRGPTPTPRRLPGTSPPMSTTTSATCNG